MNLQTHQARPAALPVPPSGLPEADRPQGCGWFESSHELHQGMRVIEHAGFDALPPGAVPLAWQLAWL